MKLCDLDHSKVYYIAGPMTGYEQFNYPKFHQVTAIMRGENLVVLSPAENFTLAEQREVAWSDAVRTALRQLLDADCLVLLPGWDASAGTKIERKVASVLGMPIYDWSTLYDG